VADLLIPTRIDWVREHCLLLRGISAEFARTRPFAGLTIGAGIHLEAKTVALILTLRDGGARVISTGNLNSTQPDAVEYLRAEGVTVIGAATKDAAERDGYLREVLAAEPELILDNGGDLFARYLEQPYDALIGGTEETTRPPAGPRAHVQPGRAPAAGQLHRVDGPRLRLAGPLPGGGGHPRRRRHQLRGPGAGPHRCRRGQQLPRPQVPAPVT
jgi:hypothetical protein